MVKRLTKDFEFCDSRGKLVQLVHEGFKQVNVLISHKGVIRGEHYHKIVTEAFYIISGQVEVSFYVSGYEKNKEQIIFSEGDFFEVQPGIVHRMFFPTECIMLQLYDEPVIMQNGKKDIYSEN